MYKVYFMTFGCKVNHYETDCMKQLFREKGFYVTDAPEGADAVVINSCTVTSSGDSRTLTALRKMRESLPEAVIVLTGCYPQASPDYAVERLHVFALSRTDDCQHGEFFGARLYYIY